MAEQTPKALSPAQLSALFDILTHHETYTEVENFKYPGTIENYGYPFAEKTAIPSSLSSGKSSSLSPAATPNTSRSQSPARGGENDGTITPAQTAASKTSGSAPLLQVPGQASDDGAPRSAPQSASPLMQTLLTRFVLTFPGVGGLSRDFWQVKVQGILHRFGEAELSESFDKGALGLRKNLATLYAGILEMVARGVLGGVEERQPSSDRKKEDGTEKDEQASRKFDLASAQDLEKAWDQAVQGFVYGDLVDEMFAHMTKTEDYEGHSSMIEAATRYAIVHLASFLHHVFTLSPEGPYLLKLIENINTLVPYKMVKQTLRVGNAATMINGMVRLLLTKLSVGSITNWVGLTTGADDGMNLLQRIISLVLSWDSSDFKKTVDKVERTRAPERPSEESLTAVKEYVAAGGGHHEDLRKLSKTSPESIIMALLKSHDPSIPEPTQVQHQLLLEYLSAQLSIRDRDAITSVLCRQSPDLFTTAIKDCVANYDPMIRSIHSCVDLREHLESGQSFIEDVIKTAKPKKSGGAARTGMFGWGAGSATAEPEQVRMASVEDYVNLLMRNRPLLYRWVHALASQCPDVWGDFRVWCNTSMRLFGRSASEEKQSSSMDQRLNSLFASLPKDRQTGVLEAIDQHATYLSALKQASHQRLQQMASAEAVGDSQPASFSEPGPGVYLSRWQDLLDESTVTADAPYGKPRTGKDVKDAVVMGKTGVEGVTTAGGDVKANGPERPDVSAVVDELQAGFRNFVRDVGGSGGSWDQVTVA